MKRLLIPLLALIVLGTIMGGLVVLMWFELQPQQSVAAPPEGGLRVGDGEGNWATLEVGDNHIAWDGVGPEFLCYERDGVTYFKLPSGREFTVDEVLRILEQAP